MGDLQFGGDAEQFVLAVEEGELAAVAGGEFEHAEAGAGRGLGWGGGAHLTVPGR